MKTMRSVLASRLLRAVAMTLVLGMALRSQGADHALSFATQTQIVNTTGMVTSTSFTFEGWFKVFTFTGENQIVAQYQGGHVGRMIVALRNAKASFFIGGTWLDGTANMPSNTWTHIAVTRSGSTANIYINGALDKTSTTFPSAAIPAIGITIGGLNILNSGFRGQIAEVRAWNTVRTQPQIQSGMSTRLTGNEAGLAGYWRIDEGMGSVTLDHAASADGIISGASWSAGVSLPVFSIDPSGAWSATSGGNWSDTANWLGAAPAQGINGTAFFTNNPPAAIAVANDVSDLQLGRIFLTGTGYALTGNAITLTNTYVSTIIESTNGTHALNIPITTTCGNVYLETRSPAAVSFGDAISGPAALLINPSASGGGAVTLSAANTYAGPVTLGSGKLTIASLADGGAPSSLGTSSAAAANLRIGPATLSYSGPEAVTDRGLTLQPGSGKAALLSADTNTTFGGTVNSLSGAFIKRGKGTLTFTGTGSNVFSRAQSGNLNGFAEYPANGDSPANGFGGFNVIEGKMVLGADGQTNIINGEAWVGVRTTSLAAKEITGELTINGGYTRMNSYLCLGRDNGTTNTAPVPLQPTLTITDGTLSAYNLIVAYGNTLNNTRPVLNIHGGLFEVDNEFRMGDQMGETNFSQYATINVYGGTVRHAHATQGLVFGWRNPACSGSLNLFGGLVQEAALVKMGQYGSTSRLNLHGGVLRAQNIVQSNPNTNYGQSHVFFNGGVFQPNAAGLTMGGLTSASVSTNGALFDTTYADFTVAQNLLHDSALAASADGGLVKLGTNTLTLFSYGSTYTGDTVISNGTLCVAGALPSGNAVTVAPDGELLVGGSATQTVSAASLTLDGTARLGFAFTADGASNDSLTVAATPSLAGKRVTLYLQNTRLPFTRNGTYTVLAYGGADPDLSGLTVANPVYGKTYEFAFVSGTVTVKIGSDATTASVWNVDSAGSWATGTNWTVAQPGTAGSLARFDDAITGPVTVSAAGETVGEIFFNNPNAYTLGGTALTLNNGASPAKVTVEAGAHTIAAPVTLAGDATLNLAPATLLNLGPATGASSTLTAQGNGLLALTAAPSVQSLVLNVPEIAFSNTMTVSSPVALPRTVTWRPAMATTVTVDEAVSGAGGVTKVGSNMLSLAAANTYTGITRIDGGTLAANTLANGGQPSSIGASAAANGNLLLGPATLRYTGPSITIDRGYTLQPGSTRAGILYTENDLTFAGKIQGSSGGFIKTGPGTLRYTYPGPQTLGVNEANIDVVQNLSPSGDSPVSQGFQAFTVSNGKVVMGVPGQTNTISARMTIGHCTTLAAGAETTGELEVNAGALICNTTVSLGRANGNSTTAPGGISSRITINGGAVTFNLLALGYNNVPGYSGFNARPICDVNAGTLTINSYCNLGEVAGSTATMNVRGGTVRANGKNGSFSGSFCIGGPASGGTGTLNISGTGVVYCAHNVALSTASGATGTLALHGGLLTASNIVKHTGSQAYVRFNGGVFQPHTSGLALSGLTAAYASTNGALIDTSLAGSYTVAQNLLHEPALGAAIDGGLVKLGTNTLSLTGTGNTFNGPINVRSGLLRARVGATNDLAVAAGAAFDALGERATVGGLTGAGLLTNGVIALTGTLDAGTNGAPAGARMTVENLSLAGGATFACDWSTNSLGKVTNDFVTVTGALAAEGPGFVDFGRTDVNPIPMPFKTTLMSYGTFTGTFAGWKAVGTGLPEDAHPALVVTAGGGLVTVEVRYGGTLIMLR